MSLSVNIQYMKFNHLCRMTWMLPYTVFNAIKKVTPRKKIRETNRNWPKKMKISWGNHFPFIKPITKRFQDINDKSIDLYSHFIHGFTFEHKVHIFFFKWLYGKEVVSSRRKIGIQDVMEYKHYVHVYDVDILNLSCTCKLGLG